MIDLSNPIKGEWTGRGFGRYYLWTYACPLCGQKVFLRGSTFRGKHPVPELGGIHCDCEEKREKESQRQAETA